MPKLMDLLGGKAEARRKFTPPPVERHLEEKALLGALRSAAAKGHVGEAVKVWLKLRKASPKGREMADYNVARLNEARMAYADVLKAEKDRLAEIDRMLRKSA